MGDVETGYLICGGEGVFSPAAAKDGVVRIIMMRNSRSFLRIWILFLLLRLFVQDRYDLKFSVIDYIFYVK